MLSRRSLLSYYLLLRSAFHHNNSSSKLFYSSQKKQGDFFKSKSKSKVKLYPGYQDSVEDKLFENIKPNAAADESSAGYARKIIEDFYGLNELEYDRKEEDDTELDKKDEKTIKEEKKFDLNEAMKLLENEKIEEICCIKLPSEVNYADYLIIGTCVSQRHLNAAFLRFYRNYKMSYRIKNSLFKHLANKTKTSKERKWCVMDFGEIVIHLFLPQRREEYDLETLWTCGLDNDEKYNQFIEKQKELESKLVFVDEEQENLTKSK